jgi:hypothetical protein
VILAIFLVALTPFSAAQQHRWDVRIQDTVAVGKVELTTTPWPDSIGIPISIWADDTLGGFSLAVISSDNRVKPTSFSHTGSIFNTAGSTWTAVVCDTSQNAIGFGWFDTQAHWQSNPQGLIGTVYFRIAPITPSGTVIDIDSTFIAPAIYCEISTVVGGHVHTVRPAPFTNGGGANIKLVAPYVCGDADASGGIDISDAVYLISYIFAGGPAPVPLLAGDANCDSSVDISDAVYLIAYIFAGGPAPCSNC